MLLLALVEATVASWPKIPPGIWWHETLRNKLELAVDVPLNELFWHWPYQLLVIGMLTVRPGAWHYCLAAPSGRCC